jgi:ADP-ribosyl-[dinitrogen reductase] hydrolase
MRWRASSARAIPSPAPSIPALPGTAPSCGSRPSRYAGAPIRQTAVEAARAQSVTTHGAPAAVEGCALLAEILVAAIATGDKAIALRLRESADPLIAVVAAGSWRGKPRKAIRSSGYVVHTLEAALWCVDRTANFCEAVLLAANLGDDADTVAAVTRNLARFEQSERRC